MGSIKWVDIILVAVVAAWPLWLSIGLVVALVLARG
jgi:hypothetical protein